MPEAIRAALAVGRFGNRHGFGVRTAQGCFGTKNWTTTPARSVDNSDSSSCHDLTMTDATLSDADEPDREELLELYGSVGWTAYTRQPEILVQAVRGSLRVVTARSRGKLVGLARIVGDGATIAYLQDVLVDPSYRRRGLGRRLVQAALRGSGEVRQQVLLTDDEPGQRAFYQALGFVEVGAAEP